MTCQGLAEDVCCRRAAADSSFQEKSRALTAIFSLENSLSKNSSLPANMTRWWLLKYQNISHDMCFAFSRDKHTAEREEMTNSNSPHFNPLSSISREFVTKLWVESRENLTKTIRVWCARELRIKRRAESTQLTSWIIWLAAFTVNSSSHLSHVVCGWKKNS